MLLLISNNNTLFFFVYDGDVINNLGKRPIRCQVDSLSVHHLFYADDISFMAVLRCSIHIR